MVGTRTKCAAHDELFDLIKKVQDTQGATSVMVGRLEERMKALSDSSSQNAVTVTRSSEEHYSEFDRQLSSIVASINIIKNTFEKEQQGLNNQIVSLSGKITVLQEQLKHRVTLRKVTEFVGAAGGLSGLAALISVLFKGRSS
jgi:hypothetical protein